MSKTQVVEVKQAPQFKSLAMMAGIRTKEQAETWASKNGYPVAYLWKDRERVYADRSTKVS